MNFKRFVGPYQTQTSAGYNCGPCDSNYSWNELSAECNCDDSVHHHCPGCDHIVVVMRDCDED